jgi:general secretion pathway protein E
MGRGRGCEKCNDSGYLGRLGYFEFLRINPALRRAIAENRPAADLARLVEDSFTNMRTDGMAKAAAGLSTIEEVLRATQDTEDVVA